MPNDPNWAEVVVALAASAQALVVLVALIVARQQVKQMRLTREAAAKDAHTALEATTRPFVVVEFDLMRVHSILHIIISNVGQSAARNISISIDPPLTAAMDTEERKSANLPVFTHPIPVLPPGREIPVLFDSTISRNAGDYPDRYEVSLTYEGPLGTYEESTVLDLGVWSDLHYIDRKELHDLAESVAEIGKTLGRWTSGFDGLHVRTDADLANDVQERAERWREIALQQKAAEIEAERARAAANGEPRVLGTQPPTTKAPAIDPAAEPGTAGADADGSA